MWFLVAGFVSGIVSGMFGIGGALILIPILTYFFNFTQHQAQGTSLMVLLPPIGLLAAIQYYKAGYVDVGAAIWIAIGLFVGAWFGAFGAIKMSNVMLQRAFAVFIILVGINMLYRAR
jgi:uncharacterized membrane protein YfcA